jgi:hypothetical protein
MRRSKTYLDVTNKRPRTITSIYSHTCGHVYLLTEQLLLGHFLELCHKLDMLKFYYTRTLKRDQGDFKGEFEVIHCF